MDMVYQNHRGESIRIGKDDNWEHLESDLFSYQWEFDSELMSGADFFKTTKEKSLTIAFFADTLEEALREKNRLYEVAEVDIDAKRKGKIIIGEYYLECVIIECEVGEWVDSEFYLEAKCGLFCENPVWIKEHKFQFLPNERPEKSVFLRYNYRYPYNYRPSLPIRTFTSSARIASPAKLIIYGYADNPSIYIGGNLYQVNLEVPEGGRLEIDGKNQKIRMINRQGEIYEAISFRNKGIKGSGSYIFEKIKPGFNEVSYVGDYGFDLFLYEERGIPEWI